MNVPGLEKEDDKKEFILVLCLMGGRIKYLWGCD